MPFLCRIGLHKYHVYPQATQLFDLRHGRVWGFCDRCDDARVLQVSKPAEPPHDDYQGDN